MAACSEIKCWKDRSGLDGEVCDLGCIFLFIKISVFFSFLVVVCVACPAGATCYNGCNWRG